MQQTARLDQALAAFQLTRHIFGPHVRKKVILVGEIADSPYMNPAQLAWSEQERLDFITFIANNPMAGDVIPGSGCVRKVRWAKQGKGKRGGVRVYTGR